MSTSSQMGTTGIFAKLVAQYLVAWVKQTRDDTASPVLDRTPPAVPGRPERDRANENLGAHTGSRAPRTPPAQEPVSALQGGTYGRHRGVATRQDTCTHAIYDPTDVESRLAAMWHSDERAARSDALRGADPDTLRACGMSQRQISQAGNGHVPGGWQLEQVSAGDGAAAQYRLSPTNAQSQCNCNAVNESILAMRFGEVTLVSLPLGGQQVTVVLGGAATRVL